MVWKRLFGRNKEEAKEDDAKVDGLSSISDPTTDSEPLEVPKDGLFQRLKRGLSRTKDGFVGQVEKLVTGRRIDEELFEELEDLLIQADVGVPTTLELIERLRDRVRVDRLTEGSELQACLQEEIKKLLEFPDVDLNLQGKPAIIMVVGVNGSGKTTSIAKLAYRLKSEGAKVVLGAGDTFRAAAIEQLEVWADRVGVDLISHQAGSDPAAVAYDSWAAAKARNADVLIFDTAGRLQTKKNLMAELGKVHRVVQREAGRDVDEVLLVVDATTGQNAMSQAKLFSEVIPVTGIVLTKLDGTAKGGIVLALANELKIPVKLIGVGETFEDLQDFDAAEFTRALFN